MSEAEVKVGHYITIEGNEGVGKSTQIDKLVELMKASGREVIRVREPGGSVRGEFLREYLKQKDATDPLTVTSELLLFGAARDDLFAKVVAPALAEGKIVIADRSYFSTYALQVHPHAEENQMLMHLFNAMTSANMQQVHNIPMIVVNLTLEEEIRQARLVARGIDHTDSFETRGADYDVKVAEAYGMLAQQPGVLTFDANEDADTLSEKIFDQVMVTLNAREAELRDNLAKLEEARAEEAAKTPEQIAEEEALAAEAQRKAEAPLEYDVMEAELLAEANRHAETLRGMYKGDFALIEAEWNRNLETITGWIGIHIAELREKGTQLDEVQFGQTVQRIGGTIGQMLGAFMTLRSMDEMIAAKNTPNAEELNQPAEEESTAQAEASV